MSSNHHHSVIILIILSIFLIIEAGSEAACWRFVRGNMEREKERLEEGKRGEGKIQRRAGAKKRGEMRAGALQGKLGRMGGRE